MMHIRHLCNSHLDPNKIEKKYMCIQFSAAKIYLLGLYQEKITLNLLSQYTTFNIILLIFSSQRVAITQPLI